MKRIVFLMLVVSIACAGCEVKESSTSWITGNGVQPVRNGEGHELTGVTHTQIVGFQDVAVNISELEERIKRVEKVLPQIKITPKSDKALLSRIDNLETSIESQRAELRENITKLEDDLSEAKITPKPDKALLARIDNLETALESQKEELRENITKLKEGLPKSEGTSGGGWWTPAAIATIISTLIAGSVAVHRSRKVRYTKRR